MLCAEVLEDVPYVLDVLKDACCTPFCILEAVEVVVKVWGVLREVLEECVKVLEVVYEDAGGCV